MHNAKSDAHQLLFTGCTSALEVAQIAKWVALGIQLNLSSKGSRGGGGERGEGGVSYLSVNTCYPL